MFSWSKKGNSKKKSQGRRGGGGPVLNEFGLPVSARDDGNDEELEAELRALAGGVITVEEEPELNDEGSDVEAEFMRMFGEKKGKKKAKKGKKHDVIDDSDILKESDIPVDQDDLGNEEDDDVDENDPELLGELMDLAEGGEDEEDEGEEGEDEEEDKEDEPETGKKERTILNVLQERLSMYKLAEAKAKENNESSRARRFNRGIKTLQQLIKKAESGQPVLDSDIPPVIAVNLKPAAPVPPAPAPSLSTVQINNDIPPSGSEIIQNVVEPAPDDQLSGMSSLTISDKPLETTDDLPQPAPSQPESETEPSPVIENALLSMLRSRRNEYKDSALAAKRDNDLETALKYVKCVKKLNSFIASVENGEEIDENDIPPSLAQTPLQKNFEKVTPLKFEAPDDVDDYEIPTTVLEALNQRLRIYEGFRKDSERKGDDVGVRRNSKIVQVYMEAIKLHKAGKKVPLLKLPTPPGCPPIPIPFEVDDDDV